MLLRDIRITFFTKPALVISRFKFNLSLTSCCSYIDYNPTLLKCGFNPYIEALHEINDQIEVFLSFMLVTGISFSNSTRVFGKNPLPNSGNLMIARFRIWNLLQVAMEFVSWVPHGKINSTHPSSTSSPPSSIQTFTD